MYSRTEDGAAASYIDAKLDTGNDSWTPLLAAIETDLPLTVKLLCDNGAGMYICMYVCIVTCRLVGLKPRSAFWMSKPIIDDIVLLWM